jgi:hypothetical protein
MLTLFLHRLHQRLRKQRGLVALEFLAVFGAWLLSIAFLLDMALVLGNGAAMQAAVNRAAVLASAEGCVSQENAASLPGLNAIEVSGVRLQAVWVKSSASGFDANARAGAVAAIDSGGNTAACSPSVANGGADVVPQANYMFLDLEYNQTLWLFPSIHIRKTALAISSSFNVGTSTP